MKKSKDTMAIYHLSLALALLSHACQNDAVSNRRSKSDANQIKAEENAQSRAKNSHQINSATTIAQEETSKPSPLPAQTAAQSEPISVPQEPQRYQKIEQSLRELVEWYFAHYSMIPPIDRLTAREEIKSRVMTHLKQDHIIDYTEVIHQISQRASDAPEICYELLWHLQKSWEVAYLPVQLKNMHQGAKVGAITGTAVMALSIATTFYDFKRPEKLPASIANLNRRFRLIRFTLPIAGFAVGREYGEAIDLPPSPAHISNLITVDSVDWEQYAQKEVYDDLLVMSSGITATILVGELAAALTAARIAKLGSRLRRFAAWTGVGLLSAGAGELAQGEVERWLDQRNIDEARNNLKDAAQRFRLARIKQQPFEVYWEAQQLARSCEVYAYRLEAEALSKFDDFVANLGELSTQSSPSSSSKNINQEYHRILSDLRQALPQSQLIVEGEYGFDLDAWRNLSSPASYQRALLSYSSLGFSKHMIDVLLQCASLIEDMRKPFVSHLTEELLEKAHSLELIRRYSFKVNENESK